MVSILVGLGAGIGAVLGFIAIAWVVVNIVAWAEKFIFWGATAGLVLSFIYVIGETILHGKDSASTHGVYIALSMFGVYSIRIISLMIKDPSYEI